jgi:REP-associated tyrosine transposase
MPRPPRNELAGGIFHVTARGNRQAPVFADDLDRTHFLSFLDEIVRRFRWKCFAYCLMTNHVHLVVETPEPNLGEGMCRLNGRHAQLFNKRWDLTGHVFQGRFRSDLVESDVHLLELFRYVVLNPVRAGACSSPADWPWSSYAATVGTVASPRFLSLDRLSSYFGRSRAQAAREFELFVRDGMRRLRQ